MANGAPRGKPNGPTREQAAQARAMLEKAVAEAPPYFELVEVRQFNAALLQTGEDSFAIIYDTPGGRRYAFPISRDILNKMSEMFTRAKLGVPSAGGPPMPPPRDPTKPSR